MFQYRKFKIIYFWKYNFSYTLYMMYRLFHMFSSLKSWFFTGYINFGRFCGSCVATIVNIGFVGWFRCYAYLSISVLYHWPLNMRKAKLLMKLISNTELHMFKGQWYILGFCLPYDDMHIWRQWSCPRYRFICVDAVKSNKMDHQT